MKKIEYHTMELIYEGPVQTAAILDLEAANKNLELISMQKIERFERDGTLAKDKNGNPLNIFLCVFKKNLEQ